MNPTATLDYHQADEQQHLTPEEEKLPASFWIELIMEEPVPEQGWNDYDLADVCNCSPQRISEIRLKAHAKLKKAARKKGLSPLEVLHGLLFHPLRHLESSGVFFRPSATGRFAGANNILTA